MSETVAEKYKREYREHLIRKYGLADGASWDEIEVAGDKANRRREELA